MAIQASAVRAVQPKSTAKNGKARAKLTMIDPPASRPAPRFGFWNHYGWKLPDDFDAPDPEIEALFYDGPIFPEADK